MHLLFHKMPDESCQVLAVIISGMRQDQKSFVIHANRDAMDAFSKFHGHHVDYFVLLHKKRPPPVSATVNKEEPVTVGIPPRSRAVDGIECAASITQPPMDACCG